MISSTSLVQKLFGFFESPSLQMACSIFVMYGLTLLFSRLRLTHLWHRSMAALSVTAALCAGFALAASANVFEPNSCMLRANFNRFIIESEQYLKRQVSTPGNVAVYVDSTDRMQVGRLCGNIWNGEVAGIAYSFAMLGSSFFASPWPRMKPVDDLPESVFLEWGAKPGAIIAVFSSGGGGVAAALRSRFELLDVGIEDAGLLEADQTKSLPVIRLLRVLPTAHNE
jgi:hypothetical protein